MAHKSSIKLSCVYASLQGLQTSPSATAVVSASSNRRQSSTSTSPQLPASSRRQASTSDGPFEIKFHMWPQAISPNKLPTPYQIFNMDKSGAYSKKSFYELAKIYHPDRAELLQANISEEMQVSQDVRTDRFRMIVTAHEILSDPSRRKAYDIYGAGWEVRGGFSRSASGPFTQTDWRMDERGSPAQNATWEDWERWYAGRGPQARPRKKSQQEEQYLPNPTFISAVALLAAIGSYVQFNRAEKRSLAMMDQRVKQHAVLSDDLTQRRIRSVESSNRPEDQVERFLRNRDKHLAMVAKTESQYEKFHTGRHSRRSQGGKDGESIVE